MVAGEELEKADVVGEGKKGGEVAGGSLAAGLFENADETIQSLSILFHLPQHTPQSFGPLHIMARRGKSLKLSEGTSLLAVIGDEATVTGFLLTGIGERNHKGEANFFIVDANTPQPAIEDAFTRFISRPEIVIVLINQNIAERELRHLINAHTAVLPTILEIPSKDCPYDAEKDSIMQRAANQLYGPEKAKGVLSGNIAVEFKAEEAKE